MRMSEKEMCMCTIHTNIHTPVEVFAALGLVLGGFVDGIRLRKALVPHYVAELHPYLCVCVHVRGEGGTK